MTNFCSVEHVLQCINYYNCVNFCLHGIPVTVKFWSSTLEFTLKTVYCTSHNAEFSPVKHVTCDLHWYCKESHHSREDFQLYFWKNWHHHDVGGQGSGVRAVTNTSLIYISFSLTAHQILIAREENALTSLPRPHYIHSPNDAESASNTLPSWLSHTHKPPTLTNSRSLHM